MASNGNLNFTNVNKVTFEGVGSAPNAVIDTTTGKIGVGVDNPDANLHVVGNSYVSTNLELGGTLIMGTVNVEARHALSAITATGNITPHTVEFTNPTTGLVTTGNVSVGGELTVSSNLTVTGGDVNMLHTSNTASLKLNSNVVTEFPRSKKLIKYPRVALTGYSQDGYVVSSTTNYYDSGNPLYPWQVFNDSGHRYQSNRSDYSSSTGNYTGTVNQTTVDGSLIGGDWVQLELPNKISLNRFTVALNMGSHGGRMGRSYVLTGSNNGSTWTTVSTHTQSYGNGADGNHVNHNVNSTTTYKYYRLIATSTFHNTQANGGPWALGKWELYGTPEYDPEADGVDVVVKSLPNVPNTDWLEVYYDAKDYNDVTATVDNKTGVSASDITISNSGGTITFDDEYKAWTFGGSDSRTDTITATLPSTFQGNQIHSVSTWFKYNVLGDDAIFSISNGNEATNDAIGVRLDANSGSNDDGQDIRYYHWDNDLMVKFPNPPLAGRWYHMVVTYTGSTSDVRRGKSVYIDGELCPFVSETTSGELSLTGSAQLQLGKRNNGGNEFYGSIANFRLFNRVLTSDEIYQLYAYQKEDFGHSTNNMTLKAGRLGIGTSEPRAALDVRGDIYGGCPVFFTVYAYNGDGVANNPTGTSGGTIIQFNKTLVNKGGAYDTSNGRCTFPVSGYYEVFFRGGTSSTSQFHAQIFANGNAPGSGGWPDNVTRVYDNSGGQYRNAGTIQFFYYFTAGEYIEVRIFSGSFNEDNYNSFSVKYLSN